MRTRPGVYALPVVLMAAAGAALGDEPPLPGR